MTQTLNFWNFEAVRKALTDAENIRDFTVLCVEAVRTWTDADPDFYHSVRLIAPDRVEIDLDYGTLLIAPSDPSPITINLYLVFIELNRVQVALCAEDPHHCAYVPDTTRDIQRVRYFIIDKLSELYDFATELRE